MQLEAKASTAALQKRLMVNIVNEELEEKAQEISRAIERNKLQGELDAAQAIEQVVSDALAKERSRKLFNPPSNHGNSLPDQKSNANVISNPTNSDQPQVSHTSHTQTLVNQPVIKSSASFIPPASHSSPIRPQTQQQVIVPQPSMLDDMFITQALPATPPDNIQKRSLHTRDELSASRPSPPNTFLRPSQNPITVSPVTIDSFISHQQTGKSLGLLWSLKSGSFQFSSSLKSNPTTHRGVLSTISSTYDRLNFNRHLLG